MKVRVVGDASLGWLDAVELWGASVEGVISQRGNIKHLVETLYSDVYVAPLADGLRMLPHRSWNGIVLSTIETVDDAIMLTELVETWGPAIVLTAGHSSISRPKFHEWTNLADIGYEGKVQHRCCHQDFGGVTTSKWKVAFSWKASYDDI